MQNFRQIKKIVKSYATELTKHNFKFSAIFLFGSNAKGKANEFSDIDIAVVSDKFKRNRHKNENTLWYLRRNIDSRIEPHAFTVEDFQNKADPMVHEIKTTGIQVI